jgi:hypothetical protein
MKMCGGSRTYNGQFNNGSPIYGVDSKKQHISFYSEAGHCEGSTEWCIKHCFALKYPLPTFKEERPFYDLQGQPHELSANMHTALFNSGYELSYFNEKQTIDAWTRGAIEDLRDSEIWDKQKTQIEKNIIYHANFRQKCLKDISGAQYLTFMASGTLDVFEKESGNTSPTKVIETLCRYWPAKKVRFFIRKPLTKNYKPMRNAVIAFSLDRDSAIENKMYATTDSSINLVAVVDHNDNRELIVDLMDGYALPVIRCTDCGETQFLCFHSSQKSVLLMNYQ